MSELLSMVVPLDTLPGWPSVQDPTVLQSLGLLIGFPVLAFIVVIAIAKIGNMAKGNRDDGAVTDSLWVGGREVSGREIEGGPAAETKSGGAGARW